MFLIIFCSDVAEIKTLIATTTNSHKAIAPIPQGIKNRGVRVVASTNAMVAI